MAEERTIQNMVCTFLNSVFPMVESWCANKKLRVKLADENGI